VGLDDLKLGLGDRTKLADLLRGNGLKSLLDDGEPKMQQSGDLFPGWSA
jgi:hypothetical protein